MMESVASAWSFGRATPHGTAAALKAEAPERHSMWRRAYEASERDMRRNYMAPDRPYLDADGLHRLTQRGARKVSNARKQRRGWR